MPVLFVVKHVLPVVSPVDDVVDQTVVDWSQGAGHGQKVSRIVSLGQLISSDRLSRKLSIVFEPEDVWRRRWGDESDEQITEGRYFVCIGGSGTGLSSLSAQE